MSQIPEAAVEAAEELVDQFAYDVFGAFPTYSDRDQLIKAILEAAAPFMIREARCNSDEV